MERLPGGAGRLSVLCLRAGPSTQLLLIDRQTRGEDEVADGSRDQNAVAVLGGEATEVTGDGVRRDSPGLSGLLTPSCSWTPDWSEE